MKVVSFVFPRFAISLKISRQFFDQLAVVSWSYVFLRFWTPVTFLASSSDWFIWLSERFVIRQSIYFVSGLTCLTSQIWPFPFGKEVILHKPAKRREFPSAFDPHVELVYGDCYLYFQLSPQDSLGFWIPRRGLWIPDSLSMEFLFRIPIVSRIPDSLSCIPYSTSKISRIRDS